VRTVLTRLFTDVEGSARLLHELGDDYAEALHEHRRRFRAPFAEHEGVEVETQGDAFFVAFARASDAVAALCGLPACTDRRADSRAHGIAHGRASADRRELRGLDVHKGARIAAAGHVDVHKGARIAAAGHGGQVLLSRSTRALVDADVRDLGVHRLKDLSAPERIFQLEI
jgi:class 3 adenylate cyclase